VKEIHELPCLKRKLVHSSLSCIWSVDKKQIRQTQRMELFIVTYRGGVLLPRNVIDGLQPLESKEYQVEFDPGRRVISLSLGDQITTTLATSVLPVCSEQNS